jgi:EmrB/QacA subfamily drug resistance transporter
MNKHERLTLIAAVLGSGMAFLDGFIVNIALPTIAANLHTDYSGLQWIVDGYLLTLSALILIGGSLGDIFGQKRVFQLGVISFAVASIACGISPNIETLTISRILQGIAGALLVPSSLAVINTNVSEARRGKAIGIWTAFSAIFPAVGPLIGAILIPISWRLIFFINIPLALATLYFVNAGVTKKEQTSARRKIDYVGGFLAVAGLAGTTYGLIEGPAHGWSQAALYSIILGLAAIITFVVYESRAKAPMLPLSLFKSRNFSGANLATLAMYAALGGLLFAVTLYLLTAMGYPPFAAGLAFFPVTVLLFFFSGKTGELSARIGPRIPMTVGPLIASLGFLLMLRIDPSHNNYFLYVFPSAIVFGLGLVFTVAPLTTTVMTSVSKDHSGVASAVNNAVARFASLIIVAFLGVVAAQATATALSNSNMALSAKSTSTVQHAVAAGLKDADKQALPAPERDAVAAAASDAQRTTYADSVLLCAALAAAAGVISYVVVRNPAKPQPRAE